MLRRLLPAAAFAALALAAPTPAAAAERPSSLERSVLQAVQDAGFDDVLDFTTAPDAGPAPRIAATPNVDVAVLALHPSGRVAEAANVLLSRDYPNGVVVPVNKDLGTDAVRWRAWDIDRSDGKTPWTAPWPAGSDLVAGRESAPLEFMSPYPASLFKVLPAWGVLRLIDQGQLTLDTPFTYDPPEPPNPATGLCGRGAPITKTIAQWLDPMITESSNQATCAMLKLLHDRPGNGVAALNAEMASLGLTTLQVKGTDPATGGSWNPGQISMTALDTARFFLLVDGAPGVLWRTAAGRKITADTLSAASRTYFQKILREQGFREVLTTTNFCGLDYPAAGIPARVDERWIQPDGTVTVGGLPYPADVRPCNQAATVDFLSKNGLTTNYGAEAGIVRNLPGKPHTRYVVAVLSNLGYRYGDARFADLPDYPCFLGEANYVCYSEAFAKLGAQIHGALAGRPSGQPAKAKAKAVSRPAGERQIER